MKTTNKYRIFFSILGLLISIPGVSLSISILIFLKDPIHLLMVLVYSLGISAFTAVIIDVIKEERNEIN